MWEHVYAMLDSITDNEKLIGAYWYNDDGAIEIDDNGNRLCILCIQLSPERLDYEEVLVSL